MSVSFYGYVFNTDRQVWNLPADAKYRLLRDMPKAANQDWDEYYAAEPVPNPFYDDTLDVNIHERNAGDIFRMMGVSKESPCIPIAEFVDLVAKARRRLIAKPSEAIELVVEQVENGPTFYHCGRDVGHLEAILARLVTLAYSFSEYGATHIGWG